MLDISEYLVYRAWLQLEPCRPVEAMPKFGAIAMDNVEIFRDPCSDRLFFSKHHSEKSTPVTMATISLSFPTESSAEIQAIASGTDYVVHKEFKQRCLFTAIVNQNGFGVLESKSRILAKYALILDPDAVIDCEGYRLAIADALGDIQTIVLKPDGMFSVSPSLFGKKISAHLQIVLLDTVVMNTNTPLPPITLHTVLKAQDSDQFYLAVINDCYPVLEQFDPDANTITLRLAFDAIGVKPQLLS